MGEGGYRGEAQTVDADAEQDGGEARCKVGRVETEVLPQLRLKFGTFRVRLGWSGLFRLG